MPSPRFTTLAWHSINILENSYNDNDQIASAGRCPRFLTYPWAQASDYMINELPAAARSGAEFESIVRASS